MPQSNIVVKSSSLLYSVLPASLIESSKGRAIGPDLSHWKDYYDPAGAPNTADFAITKATEGINFVDPKLDAIWSGIQKLSITGLFHYQRSGYSWLSQANYFLSFVKDHNPNLVILDVEGINNTMNDTFFQDSFRILQYLKEQVQNDNVKVMLYTNPSIFQNHLYPIWVEFFGRAGEEEAMTIPLWIAQYWLVRSPDKEPGMPVQRSKWDLWQWTDSAKPSDWGAGSLSLDLNVYNGDAFAMKTWLNLSVEDPIPEPPPIEIPTPEEPPTETQLWRATVTSTTRVNVRSFPIVDSTSYTGLYAYPGQVLSGKLWVGNGYVWLKIFDLTSQLYEKWIAVRRIDGSQKLLKLELLSTPDPLPTGKSFWRVKHDREIGNIWRAGLPEVHPLFVDMSERSGTHFSPLRKWSQLLSRNMNPTMADDIWTKIYWYNYWIANGQGFGIDGDPRANYVTGKNLEYKTIKVESLTTGGSLLEGIEIGDWVEVVGLDYESTVSLDFLKANPQFWTRGVYASGTGIPYRMLGHKFSGGALIHPLIVNSSFGLYIQKYKLQRWTNPEPPDPLRLYL